MFSNRPLPYAFDRPIVGVTMRIRKLNNFVAEFHSDRPSKTAQIILPISSCIDEIPERHVSLIGWRGIVVGISSSQAGDSP